MNRREFLAAAAAATILPPVLLRSAWAAEEEMAKQLPFKGLATYATPRDAMKAGRETELFVAALYTGTPVNKPDYLAVVDVNPDSPTYSQVTKRIPMPHIGDELHHFGWNVCSSCHGQEGKIRRYLVVPGLTSGNIHVIDLADLEKPEITKVITSEQVRDATNLSGPHTVHCAPDGSVIISMLGDGEGNGPGGFLTLDQQFNITGRWEKSTEGMKYNYDFWYQPRHNVMISSEWAAPNTVKQGFKMEDVEAGKYGQALHVWDWTTHEHKQTIDLGSEGLVPLELRFNHDPDSLHGFVGAALSTTLWHFYRADDGTWKADKVVGVDSIEAEGWPFPVPGLMTDILVSLDDRYLYFSDWLHGDVRQYDVSDPAHPKLTGQLWIGGVLGKGQPFRGEKLKGGPQMLQLSRDGKRLYFTNSLYSVWDNQFYPTIGKEGSYMCQIDCDTEIGGMKVNEDFFVDFGKEPDGPARAHEMRLLGGDCTSDIWV